MEGNKAITVSPMMRQYFKIKDQYKDALLFFRLGDFYELFYEDAEIASKELELTLTGKNCGLETRAPMCGVPYHAVETYMAKLIEKGYKVAICEQTSVPDGKNIVEREVVRLVTPGTVTESAMLKEDNNNYLASICFEDNCAGIAWADISTGEFNHVLIENQVSMNINDIMSRITPSEIICNSKMLAESINLSVVKFGTVCPFTAYYDFEYEYDSAYVKLQQQLDSASFNTIKDKRLCVQAAGALVSYLAETQKRALKHINHIQSENLDDYMILDANVRKTLELCESTADNKKRGSLLWLINKTSTNMGSRLLRKWINQPSRNFELINARLEFVQEIFNDVILRDQLKNVLKEITDLERQSARLSCENIVPSDFYAFGKSLLLVQSIKDLLKNFKSPLSVGLLNNLKDLNEIGNHIIQAIDKDCKNNIKDGKVFANGFDPSLDEYRNMDERGAELVTQLEQQEKEETGIKNLKISFNRVFGYFIEVTKSQLELVPYRYVRKQTIANGERYITEELKQIEIKVLQAKDLSITREIELYANLIAKCKKYIDDILISAKSLSILDCLVSAALVANEYNFVRPMLSPNSHEIKIIDGRHCVVEKLLKNDHFVPNDTLLDQEENRIMLITGPNMAGKSVYMRQVALITILAHIGYFVPAKSASIGITDRIFTRVGASDDLSTGRSTFMVEMSEVSYILSNMTPNSLILMDEIGRGTSTFDGLSIAWSIIEYLSQKTSAKILFSTHYHELTDLEGVISGVKNYKLTVREVGDEIVFVRKLMRGSANRSFGIEVAGIAGLPLAVLSRSKEILKLLENSDIGRQSKLSDKKQLSFFNNNDCANEIKAILNDVDIDSISPRHALDILADLKEKVKIDAGN